MVVEGVDPLEFNEDDEKLQVEKEKTAPTGEEGQQKSLEVDDNEIATEEKQDVNVGALYTYLSEAGILDSGKEVKSIEELENAFRAREDSAAAKYKEELPAHIREQIEAFEKGIPYEETAAANNGLKVLKSITDEKLKNKEVAIEVITSYLRSQGDTEEYIKEQIELIIDTDRFFKEGIRARNALIKKIEADEKVKEEGKLKEVEDRKKKAQEYYNEVSKYITDETSFWGIKLDTSTRKKVQEAILNPDKLAKDKNYVSLDRAIQEDPTILPQIQALYELKVLGKKGSLDVLSTTAKTKAVLEVNKILNQREGNGQTYQEKVNEINIGFLSNIKKNLRNE